MSTRPNQPYTATTVKEEEKDRECKPLSSWLSAAINAPTLSVTKKDFLDATKYAEEALEKLLSKRKGNDQIDRPFFLDEKTDTFSAGASEGSVTEHPFNVLVGELIPDETTDIQIFKPPDIKETTRSLLGLAVAYWKRLLTSPVISFPNRKEAGEILVDGVNSYFAHLYWKEYYNIPFTSQSVIKTLGTGKDRERGNARSGFHRMLRTVTGADDVTIGGVIHAMEVFFRKKISKKVGTIVIKVLGNRYIPGWSTLEFAGIVPDLRIGSFSNIFSGEEEMLIRGMEEMKSLDSLVALKREPITFENVGEILSKLKSISKDLSGGKIGKIRKIRSNRLQILGSLKRGRNVSQAAHTLIGSNWGMEKVRQAFNPARVIEATTGRVVSEADFIAAVGHDKETDSWFLREEAELIRLSIDKCDESLLRALVNVLNRTPELAIGRNKNPRKGRLA